MSDTFPTVDSVLIRRWQDAVAFRESMSEFEERIASSLEAATESLRPWFEEQGYSFLELESKYGLVNVARASWVNRKTKQPWVWFALNGLLPYGYRKTQEERTSVWICSKNLEREERSTFQEKLANRLRDRDAEWIDDDCKRDYPFGRYLDDTDDSARLTRALAPEALSSFIKDSLSKILVLGDDVEQALRATRETS